MYKRQFLAYIPAVILLGMALIRYILKARREGQPGRGPLAAVFVLGVLGTLLNVTVVIMVIAVVLDWMLSFPKPVSYTHLDVYQRQRQVWTTILVPEPNGC